MNEGTIGRLVAGAFSAAKRLGRRWEPILNGNVGAAASPMLSITTVFEDSL
jgi:hypothetical protein